MRGKNTDLDLLNGKIGMTFIRLALPILLAMMMQTLFNIVDTYFVSRLGTDAIAAMGLTFPVFMLSISLGAGISVGVSSLVARSIGARETEKSYLAATNGLLLSIAIGVFFLMAGLIGIDALLRFMGAEASVFHMSKQYILIIILAMPIKFLFHAIDGIFRGEGKTKLSMAVLISSSVMNIILDPLLIFGVGPFPQLGIGGAALATAISWTSGLMLGIFFIIKDKSSIQIKKKYITFKWKLIMGILKVGLPSSVAQGAIAFTMVFVNRFAMEFSEEAVAAYALGFRIDTITILPGVALGAATIAMLGQNFGAKRYDRVEEIHRKATIYAMSIMAGLAILVFVFPRPLLMIFLNETEGSTTAVLQHGTSYLRIMALSYTFIGMGMIANSSFQAIGKGLPTFITTAIRFFALAIPLSFTLAYLANLEVNGIWIGLAASNVFFGIVSRGWFKAHFIQKYRVSSSEEKY